MIRICASGSLAFLCSAVALAQGDKPASRPAEARVDAEAQKLWDDASAATRKLTDITYTVKATMGRGAGADRVHATVRSTVADPKDGSPFKMYRVTMLNGDGVATVEWATNGKLFQKLDPAAKKLQTLDAAGADVMPPQEIWMALPGFLFYDAGGEGLQTTSLMRQTDVESGGAQCAVVERIQEMELSDDAPSAEQGPRKSLRFKANMIKHLGLEDHLVRRFELHSKVEGGDSNQSYDMVVELSGVKGNSGLKDDDFTIKAPEGYKSEAGTAESMGLQQPGDVAELKAKAGDAAIDFKLKDLAGAEVTLASLKGRVVLLDFWATWCGPCKAAMPSLQKIHDAFKGKSVSVLGVNVFEKAPDDGKNYMAAKKYTYGCLLAGDELATAYGISSIPTMLLIDGRGVIRRVLVGFAEEEADELTKQIEELLKSPAK